MDTGWWLIVAGCLCWHPHMRLIFQSSPTTRLISTFAHKVLIFSVRSDRSTTAFRHWPFNLRLSTFSFQLRPFDFRRPSTFARRPSPFYSHILPRTFQPPPCNYGLSSLVFQPPPFDSHQSTLTFHPPPFNY